MAQRAHNMSHSYPRATFNRMVLNRVRWQGRFKDDPFQVARNSRFRATCASTILTHELSRLRNVVGKQEAIRNHFLFQSLPSHLESAKH